MDMPYEDCDYGAFEVVLKESGYVVIRALGECTEGCGRMEDAIGCIERRLKDLNSQRLKDIEDSE